jgi:hypothetical protein
LRAFFTGASLKRIWGLFYQRFLFRASLCERRLLKQPPAASTPPTQGFLRCACAFAKRGEAPRQASTAPETRPAIETAFGCLVPLKQPQTVLCH